MRATYILLLLQCLLFLRLDTALATPRLTPAEGNSLQFKTRTRNAYQVYRCSDGDWLPEAAYAVLVDFSNTKNIVGNYCHVQRPRQPKYAGTWTLNNHPGDAAESGSPISVVAGRKVASEPGGHGNLRNILAEASMHQYDGLAALVSYIARVNTKGGLPPPSGYCYEETTLQVPFDAEFYFWVQNLVPPSVPATLKAPVDRPLLGLFGRGVVSYIFDGESWKRKDIVAKLYNVPGGTLMGAYYIMPKPDAKGGNNCWRIYNPNGFEVIGKSACNPVNVSAGCLPWTLDKVTTASGNLSSLGPYTHIQMVSTRGGLLPRSTACEKEAGKIWKEPFTAIFWFFCDF